MDHSNKGAKTGQCIFVFLNTDIQDRIDITVYNFTGTTGTEQYQRDLDLVPMNNQLLNECNITGELLVIVDQHAAHERIRLEDFIRGL